jgi:hypothetical protein
MPAPAEISLGALQSHLWEAANILRGPVDAADQRERYEIPGAELCLGEQQIGGSNVL